MTADELSHKICMHDGVCIKTRQRTRLGISEYDAIADVAEKYGIPITWRILTSRGCRICIAKGGRGPKAKLWPSEFDPYI